MMCCVENRRCKSFNITFTVRVVQYCRPESSRILLLSIGKPEVSWCKVLPSVWMHWTRIDSDGKVHFLFVRDLKKFRSCWSVGLQVLSTGIWSRVLDMCVYSGCKSLTCILEMKTVKLLEQVVKCFFGSFIMYFLIYCLCQVLFKIDCEVCLLFHC